jgi:hypothetical protein
MDDSLESELSSPDPQLDQKVTDIAEISLSIPDSVISAHFKPQWWEHIRVGKIGLFGASLYLFILAINLMKSGARGITPLLSNLFAISTGANSLGFGWLFAYFIMSGSPVAAAALTFFDAGVIDELGAFTMITGSRLGASFIVIFIGFIYIMRGRDRATSLSMGTLSLTVTATTYLPSLILGVVILNTGILDGIQLHSGALLTSLIDTVIEPIANLVINLLPQWAVFLFGLIITSVSFNMFDKCLPQMTLKESQVGWVSRLVYRPVVMFILGAVITMISMSVSISLSLLIPLSHRGFVRRENVIPYIMGANITTFIDTLLAAMLLNNPAAFSIVLVEMVSVTIISIIILITLYPTYQRLMLNFTSWVTASTRNLVIFMITILITPVILLLI